MRPDSRRLEPEEDFFFARRTSYLGQVGISSNPDGSGKLTLKKNGSACLVSDEEDGRGKGKGWIGQREVRQTLA